MVMGNSIFALSKLFKFLKECLKVILEKKKTSEASTKECSTILHRLFK